jgi:peptidoglycan/LPS O-acetylase OafA/YrhL
VAPESWTILHEGKNGVNLFFVISAFLISTLLIRAKERDALNVPRFWARRALRILPLYFAVLALYVITVFAFERDAAARAGFFSNLPGFATFTSNWFVNLDSERVIFYFAWSLAAEEQFYLCWPWIERFVPRRVGVITVAVVALVVTQAVGWLYVSGATTHLAAKIISSVPAAILVGVVLAHLLNSPKTFAPLHALLGRRGSAACAAVFALLAIAVGPFCGFFGGLVVALALALLVGTCVVREDNDLAPFLRLRPIAWIGTVSYGIYLFHMLSVHAFKRGFEAVFHVSVSPVVEFAGGAVVSIVVATISYRTFESFFLARKERWLGDKPRAGASTSRTPLANTAPVRIYGSR